MTIIHVECMFCKKDMGDKEGYGETGISSGICPECFQIHYPQYAEAVLSRTHGGNDEQARREVKEDFGAV